MDVAVIRERNPETGEVIGERRVAYVEGEGGLSRIYDLETGESDVVTTDKLEDRELKSEQEVNDYVRTYNETIQDTLINEARRIADEKTSATNGELPVTAEPVNESPVDGGLPSVDEAPVTEPAVNETPVDEAPVNEAPVDEAPVNETPVDEAPVNEVPVPGGLPSGDNKPVTIPGNVFTVDSLPTANDNMTPGTIYATDTTDKEGNQIIELARVGIDSDGQPSKSADTNGVRLDITLKKLLGDYFSAEDFNEGADISDYLLKELTVAPDGRLTATLSVKNADGTYSEYRSLVDVNPLEHVKQTQLSQQERQAYANRVRQRGKEMPFLKYANGTPSKNPDYRHVTPERAYDHIYKETGYERDVANKLVDAKRIEWERRRDNLQKKKPNFGQKGIGTDQEKYEQALEKWNDDINEAENAIKFWSKVRQIASSEFAEQQREAAERARLSTQVKKTYDRDGCLNLHDLVRKCIFEGKKLVWETKDEKTGNLGVGAKRGLKYHTGYGPGERQAMQWMLASEQAGGLTPEQFAHYLWEDGKYDTGVPPFDPMEALNAILDVVGEISSREELGREILRTHRKAEQDEMRHSQDFADYEAQQQHFDNAQDMDQYHEALNDQYARLKPEDEQARIESIRHQDEQLADEQAEIDQQNTPSLVPPPEAEEAWNQKQADNSNIRFSEMGENETASSERGMENEDNYDSTIPSNTNEARGFIRRVIDKAKNYGGKVFRRIVGRTTERQSEDFKRIGVSVDDNYVHSVENTAIIHNQQKHGNPTKEAARNQIAIVEEDYLLIPDILENYDTIEKSSNKNNLGHDIIRYIKEYPDGTIYYLEEIRTGRKSLAFETMYKKQKGTGSSGGLMPKASTITPSTVPDNPNSTSKDTTNSQATQENPQNNPKQGFGSAETSRNQKAEAFNYIKFQPGTVNVDIGGGKYEKTTDWLREQGVENLVFDPFNRDDGHNRIVAERVRNEKADTVTCTNVLNVIDSAEGRANVILQAAKALKEGGTAYFSVYEGDKSGVGKQTKSDSWQENRKTNDYIDEIKQYFNDVTVKNKVIIARDPKPTTEQSVWDFDGNYNGNDVRFSPSSPSENSMEEASSSEKIPGERRRMTIVKPKHTIEELIGPEPETSDYRKILKAERKGDWKAYADEREKGRRHSTWMRERNRIMTDIKESPEDYGDYLWTVEGLGRSFTTKEELIRFLRQQHGTDTDVFETEDGQIVVAQADRSDPLSRRVYDLSHTQKERRAWEKGDMDTIFGGEPTDANMFLQGENAHYYKNIVRQLGLKVRWAKSGDHKNPDPNMQKRMNDAYGFYDASTGEIVINVDKHATIEDITRTILHEGVAHHGLREMFGQDFDTFLDNVYNNIEDNFQNEIQKLADDKYDGDMRVATEEWLARLAERTDFSNNPSLMKRIWNFFIDMLRTVGLRTDRRFNENDMRYTLWRSFRNLEAQARKARGETPKPESLEQAEDNAMQRRLGVDDKSRSVADQASETGASTTSNQRDAEYEQAVRNGDTEKARRMLEEEAQRKVYSKGSPYQGTRAFNGPAPSRNGYYETKQQRKQAFDNGDFEGEYSLGDFIDNGLDGHDLAWQMENPSAASHGDAATLESIQNIAGTVRNGRRTIKVYRAVDADIKEGTIRNGDWVTPSRKYAEEHIKLQDWKNGRIIEQEVPIDDLWWDGNDINEWGYDDGKEYAYKNTPNNRKIFDITYDENGNIIPLSQRFNDANKDIRFSDAPAENSDSQVGVPGGSPSGENALEQGFCGLLTGREKKNS